MHVTDVGELCLIAMSMAMRIAVLDVLAIISVIVVLVFVRVLFLVHTISLTEGRRPFRDRLASPGHAQNFWRMLDF